MNNAASSGPPSPGGSPFWELPALPEVPRFPQPLFLIKNTPMPCIWARYAHRVRNSRAYFTTFWIGTPPLKACFQHLSI